MWWYSAVLSKKPRLGIYIVIILSGIMINTTTCAQAADLHTGVIHLAGDWRPIYSKY